ncbi:type II secretion system protein [bacterium]|nr:type II secretion system protein [bacterium]
MNIFEEQRIRGQEGKPISSLTTLAPCGRGQGEGSKLLHKTLSRICKFAFCSLTNSTLSHRERVRSRVDFSLPEKLDCRLAGRRKTAFTLAEVLITLGIIGVVAAMTMPTLIQKHQERVTVNKVKKFYSVMSQAQLLAIKDHGYLDEWDVSDGRTKESAEKLAEYLKPYLKIAKDCGTSSGCLQYGKPIQLLNGEEHFNYDSDNRFYKLILNDGSYIWLRASMGAYCASLDNNILNACGAVWIDINGKTPPNTLGRDILYFIMTKNSLKPSAINDCNLNSYGWDCAGWILEKGNMDYLKK